MATDAHEPIRHLRPVSLPESYDLCDHSVRKHYRDFLWAAGNLPPETRRFLNAILAFAWRANRLCDIHLDRAARYEQLEETREEFRNNLMQEVQTGEYAAIVDTVQRFRIPQQYIHDMLVAADMCTRLEKFDTFDQWLQLGCRLGGTTVLACAHVLQTEKDDFESSAIHCGQAIFLTWLLGTICCDVRQLEFFMPRQDVSDLEVDFARFHPENPDKNVLRLIRLQVSRLEELFEQGGHIVNYLDLDGRRMMTTLVSMFWHLLMRIKRDPAIVLVERALLTNKEKFHFRMKHLLGLEGGACVLPGKSGDHH